MCVHAGSKTLSQEKESLLGYMLTQVVVYNGRKIVVFYVVVAAVGIHDACALDFFVVFCCCFSFSALTLLVGQQEGRPACKKTEWCGAGMVICLERGADLHMPQRMPLPLTVSCFSKIQIGLPFWYRLTRVVSDNGPLNGCVCFVVLYFLYLLN